MESAMASSKRGLNARTQACNVRGQFASVKTGAGAALKQLILVDSSSDSEGAPAPTEKVATSSAAGVKRLVASVATRTRAAAARKKGASGAPALTGKRGSAVVKKTTERATSASKKKQAPPKKAIAGASSASAKKGSASLKKAIAMGASGSKQKNKLFQDFVEEEFDEEDVCSYEWVTDNSCDMSDCMEHHLPANMDGLQWALKHAKDEAKACVDASAARYSKEAKKDIEGIFVDLYDEIKAKYKPKK